MGCVGLGLQGGLWCLEVFSYCHTHADNTSECWSTLWVTIVNCYTEQPPQLHSVELSAGCMNDASKVTPSLSQGSSH